ncbi:MAG: DUF4852 domain-containing protein [Pseudomonadota bacterium]
MQRLFILSFLATTLLLTSWVYIPAYAAKEGGEDEVHIYVEPSYRNFARLYWTLSRLEMDNIAHIDEFMRISECDVYQDYYSHEFEWRKVRESAQQFIESDSENFAVRFEFMQPIKLAQYDIEKNEFELQEDYKIVTTKRFEISASNVEDKGCGDYNGTPNYPRNVIVELSRPFGLESIEMTEATANDYISTKVREFNMRAHKSSASDPLDYRDAYLVFKLKIYASKGNIQLFVGHPERAHLLAVLEGVEVYADRGKHKLIYSQDLRRSRKKSPLELRYMAEYKQRLEERGLLPEQQQQNNNAAEKEPAVTTTTAN